MARDLKNKTVVITGAARGIGYAMADKYLEKGVKVVIIVDIDGKKGALAVKKLNRKYGTSSAEFIKGDATADLESVSRLIFSKHQTVDVLVNNAGIVRESDIRKTIETNAIATIEWSLKIFEHMRMDRGGKGGTIVNMSSILGYRVNPFFPIYQGSKFAVMGFTRSFGHEYRFKHYGVRVIALCPGLTKTGLIAGVKMTDKEIQKDCEEMIAALPKQEAEDVAIAAVDVFEKAETGTAWLIEGAEPIIKVNTDTIVW